MQLESQNVRPDDQQLMPGFSPPDGLSDNLQPSVVSRWVVSQRAISKWAASSRAVPSWLVSLLIHFLLILVLASINLDVVQTMTRIIQSGISDWSEQQLDEFVMREPVEAPEETPEPTFAMSQVQASQEISVPELESPLDPIDDTDFAKVELDHLVGQLLPRELLEARSTVSLASMLGSRSGESKSKMLAKNGGTAGSEKAVSLALKWIARHQLKDGPRAGAWNFNHGLQNPGQSSGYGQFSLAVNGATGLALLPFLGAGQTHREGQYQSTVKSGLDFLIKSLKLSTPEGVPCGSWHEPQGEMYSHAIATISLCEAYAMTQDSELAQPAQWALNFLIYAQDPQGGGWRYLPREPGDTSVVGWCLMALKSGSMGRLRVPSESYYRASRFLDFVSRDEGAYYGYVAPGMLPRRGTTAVGLLCRMYLGWPKEREGIQKGVQFLSERGPDLEDLYYSYYATQVLRHFGGSLWHQWNSQMREGLIASQIQDGQDAGSWDPIGDHTREGGRLCQTAMAAMILEVYYRHLPLYQEQTASPDDFEL